MNIEVIREAYRKAGAELVTDLGYDPADVLQDLEITGHTARITVVHRDAAGEVQVSGDQVVTHVEQKRVTAEQVARYQETVSRERAGS